VLNTAGFYNDLFLIRDNASPAEHGGFRQRLVPYKEQHYPLTRVRGKDGL